MSNSLTVTTYFICSLHGKCRQRDVGLRSLNRCLGMQDWNMLLPIELNKTAKFTGMSLTSAFRNAVRWGYRVGRVGRAVECGQMTMEAQQ